MAVLPRPPRAPLPILRPPLRPPGRREREDDQGHGVDGARSFLAATVAGTPIRDSPSRHSCTRGCRFKRHGRSPSSMVVTEHRATPPTQPAAPR